MTFNSVRKGLDILVSISLFAMVLFRIFHFADVTNENLLVVFICALVYFLGTRIASRKKETPQDD